MNKCPLKECDKEKCGWWDKYLGGCGYDWDKDISREEKIDFIIKNCPEFNKDTPQRLKDEYREKLQDYTDHELDSEFEWTDYLLGK